MTLRAATWAVAVLGVFAPGCGQDTGEVAVPHAEFVRGCSQRVEGRLASGWEAQSVVAGPLAFPYARTFADDEDGQRAALNVEKVLAVVEPGESVTVVVPAGERRDVALTYDPAAWRGLFASPPRLSDGQTSVRLVACAREQRSFTGRRLPHTQFNGGFIVRWPHCARLDVYGDGQRTQAAIPFGQRCEQ